MNEKDKEIIEVRQALRDLVFRLMDLDDAGWFMALQDVYDARWQHEETFKAG
jgi:hypothetical protein